MMHLAHPVALLLLAAIPFVWIRADGEFVLGGAKNSGARFLFASPVGLRELAALGRGGRRATVLNALRSGCLVAAIVALARPQVAGQFVETEEGGRDIILALDLSGSMRALDFMVDGKRVDRNTALKIVVKKFIADRQGDRMGLVVFGNEVYTQCPLTTDTKILSDFVSGLEVGMVGDGTALGDGLAVAVKRLRNIPGNSRVIVLVTDGVKTAGSLEPAAAAEIAKKEGIKVYTIGIGSDKPAPFPTTGMFGETRLEYLPVDLDEDTLKHIAETTGGKYFRGQEMDKLSEIYDEISALEKRVDTGVGSIEYEDNYLAPVLLAFVLFIAHELLTRTRYEAVPFV